MNNMARLIETITSYGAMEESRDTFIFIIQTKSISLAICNNLQARIQTCHFQERFPLSREMASST